MDTTVLVLSLSIVSMMICLVVGGYYIGVYAERERWNDLIKEGYIQAPKSKK